MCYLTPFTTTTQYHIYLSLPGNQTVLSALQELSQVTHAVMRYFYYQPPFFLQSKKLRPKAICLAHGHIARTI